MTDKNLRHFTTLIPNNHRFVCNDYVHGRISAALRIMCNPHKPIHMGTLKRYSKPNESYGYFFEVYTTEVAYKYAEKLIESWYPGVCQFDVPHDVDQCCFAEDELLKEACCLGG